MTGLVTVLWPVEWERDCGCGEEDDRAGEEEPSGWRLLYVIATQVDGAFVPSPGYDLVVTPAFAGPYNLTGANPDVTGVDFEMNATEAPR